MLLRTEAKAEEWRRRGVQVALGSLDDRAAVERALEDVLGFYVLLPEDPGRSDFHEHRRRMADAIGAAVGAARVPHVVMLSALSAELPHGNGPGRDLHYFEKVLREASRKLTILRACSFLENVAMAFEPARREGIYPSFFPGGVPFPSIATRDIARFAASLLADPPHESEVIDLLGPTYSVQQMAQVLGRAFEHDVRVVEIPPEAHVETLAAAGLPRHFAEIVAELFACLASGRIAPRGSRTLVGSTTLEEILA